MGTRSTQLSSPGANAKATTSILVDHLHITAVGAIIQTTNIPATDTFVEITLLNGSNATSAIATKLTSGYIGSAASIGWQGSIHTEASQWININAWGLSPSTIILTILNE